MFGDIASLLLRVFEMLAAQPLLALAAALGVATLGLAVAFPLVLLNTCGPNKHEFAFPKAVPADFAQVVQADDDIVLPNGCNACQNPQAIPVWIAPGDLCKLPGFGPDLFELCDPDDEHDWENEFAPWYHFKACVTQTQLASLWANDLCHNATTTLPYVGAQGLFWCGDGRLTQCRTLIRGGNWCDALRRTGTQGLLWCGKGGLSQCREDSNDQDDCVYANMRGRQLWRQSVNTHPRVTLLDHGVTGSANA